MTDMSNDLSFQKDTDRINYLDQLINRVEHPKNCAFAIKPTTDIVISHGFMTIYVRDRTGKVIALASSQVAREAIDQSIQQMLEKL